MNDSPFLIGANTKDGEKFICTYYQKWANMINRCYNYKEKSIVTNYSKCVLSEDWKIFSKFAKDIHDKLPSGNFVLSDFELDKDIKIPNNILYSKENTLLLTDNLNKLVTDSKSKRGTFKLGVYKNKTSKNCKKLFRSCCRSKFTKSVSKGFVTEEEAHRWWQLRKVEAIQHSLENEKRFYKEHNSQLPDEVLQCILKLKATILEHYNNNLETINLPQLDNVPLKEVKSY